MPRLISKVNVTSTLPFSCFLKLENLRRSWWRWMRPWRVITHSEGPHLSSARIQCLQLRALRCAISSLVRPFLPQLKKSSATWGIGVHTSYSSAIRIPSNTNSDAGKASFWYSSAVEQRQVWLLKQFCNLKCTSLRSKERSFVLKASLII